MIDIIEDPLAMYARPGLSHEEIEELKEAFDLFDTDSSGILSYNHQRYQYCINVDHDVWCNCMIMVDRYH